VSFEVSSHRSKGRLAFIYDEIFLLVGMHNICMYNYGLVIATMCQKFPVRKGICLPGVLDFCQLVV
jgi:hypothetical protein